MCNLPIEGSEKDARSLAVGAGVLKGSSMAVVRWVSWSEDLQWDRKTNTVSLVTRSFSTRRFPFVGSEYSSFDLQLGRMNAFKYAGLYL